jgi:hypothetical protein
MFQLHIMSLLILLSISIINSSSQQPFTTCVDLSKKAMCTRSDAVGK